MSDIKIRFLNRHNTKTNSFKLQSHKCYEIVYFLSGSGKTLIGGRSHDIKEDCICLVAPNSEHIEYIDGYGEILFIGFDYSGELPLREGVYASSDKNCLRLMGEIFSEYKSQKTGFLTAAESMLSLLLISVIRGSDSEAKPCKDLFYIKDYIEQHFDQKINFKELSLLTGYSYDHFRHIFKSRFKVSPQEYLIDIRLEKSKILLLESKLSCTDIAYRCGFSSSIQFSQMFKSRFGVSPTAYKITD